MEIKRHIYRDHREVEYIEEENVPDGIAREYLRDYAADITAVDEYQKREAFAFRALVAVGLYDIVRPGKAESEKHRYL